MTVCIAAISPNTRRVFVITDTKMTDGVFKLETNASKARTVTKDGRWVCCFATRDFTMFDLIHARMQAKLTDGDPYDRHAIRNCVMESYRAELSLASPDAPEKFGVEMLVVGFEPNGRQCILRANAYGECEVLAGSYFEAIGEHHPIAYASLTANTDFTRSTDVGLIVYRLCEAKFLAEVLESVGEETSVMSVESDGTMTILTSDVTDIARALWERRLKAKIPPRLRRRLGGGVTFDSSGEYLLGRYEDMHHETSLAYQRVTQDIEALHAMNLLTADQWHRADMLSRRIGSLSGQIVQQLEEWGKTLVRPLGVEYLLKRYSERVTELSNIRATPHSP